MRVLFLAVAIFALSLPAAANVDIFERRLSQLEEALGPITAKAEETERAQKLAGDANTIAVKDLQLQIKEMTLNMRELEMTVQSLNNQVKKLEADAKAKPEPILMPVPPVQKAPPPAPAEPALDAEATVFLEAAKKFNEGDYQGSITKFIENMKTYPEGPRFYDNMFYLALAMSALGKQADACNTLRVMIDAGDSLERGLKGRVEAEAERIRCGG